MRIPRDGDRSVSAKGLLLLFRSQVAGSLIGVGRDERPYPVMSIYRKALKGDFGELPLETPRDRNGTFEPKIVARGQTRFTGFDDKIVSMYARGMSTREITGHLEECREVGRSSPAERTSLATPTTRLLRRSTLIDTATRHRTDRLRRSRSPEPEQHTSRSPAARSAAVRWLESSPPARRTERTARQRARRNTANLRYWPGSGDEARRLPFERILINLGAGNDVG